MAIAGSNLDSSAKTAATSHTTASISGASGDVFVIAIVTSGSGVTSTPTGSGLTFTELGAVGGVVYTGVAATVRHLQVFKALLSGSFSGTLTITPTSSAAVIYVVDKFTGCDGTTPIVQSATVATNTSSPISVTLSAFGDATNNVAYMAGGLAPGSTALAVEAGGAWAQLATVSTTSSNGASGTILTGWRTGQDTSCTQTFSGTPTGAVGIAAEIKFPVAVASPTEPQINRGIPRGVLRRAA